MKTLRFFKIGTGLPIFCDESYMYYDVLSLRYMSTFEDIKMLIGTDLPVFCDESYYVSLRLRCVSTFEDIKMLIDTDLPIFCDEL